ncbi:VOC family protein [Streptomyces sp. NBC_01304]|uniref:VOC family protein n=1 Tax=Streptomyces sp. NBC_01304 TaxID=2903818 RepID=UPI002E156668|nr:VOC family protein [Streptomyces sp. NBC_01304]
MLTLGTTVLGVDDVQRALAFWSRALGYVPRDPGPVVDSVILVPPDGAAGAHLALDTLETRPQLQPRVHLDLYADDPQAEIDRLVGLGAEVVLGWQYPADADFVVLSDPEGNRFCVVDKSK